MVEARERFGISHRSITLYNRDLALVAMGQTIANVFDFKKRPSEDTSTTSATKPVPSS